MNNKETINTNIHTITKNFKIREKAFFTVIRQSGLKPKTITRLKIKHIERIMESNTPIPCKIEVPNEIENSKFGRHPSFIAEEAVNYLKKYLILERSKEKPTKESLLFITHNKPNRQISIREINRRLKPKGIQLNNFREYFKQKTIEIRINHVNYLMGNTNKLPNNYKPEDDEFYRKQYEEIKDSLNVEISTFIHRRKIQEKDLHQQNNILREQLVKNNDLIGSILPLIYADNELDPNDPEGTKIGDNLIELWQKAESTQQEALSEEIELHGWNINPKLPWIDIPVTLTNLFNNIIKLYEDYKKNEKE